MGKVSSRNDMPSTWQLEPQSQKTSPSHSPTICPDNIWLAQQNVGQTEHQRVGLPPSKISSSLCPVKDDLGLGTPAVYSIPCKCGQVYIGETGPFIETRIKEHHRNIWPGHPNKLAVAEHRVNHDHLLIFQDIHILSTVPGYMD